MEACTGGGNVVEACTGGGSVVEACTGGGSVVEDGGGGSGDAEGALFGALLWFLFFSCSSARLTKLLSSSEKPFLACFCAAFAFSRLALLSAARTFLEKAF